MRQQLFAANWKMNGSLALCRQMVPALIDALRPGAAIAICPPALYLPEIATLAQGSGLRWGTQDISPHPDGARTGELSTRMALEFGSDYAIVGHSERRATHFESDELVARKALASIEAGLTPIVCIGETQAERESGKTETIITRQLGPVIELLGAEKLAKIVLAYEPVWAIGTGLAATPEQAQAVHAFIRTQLDAVQAGLDQSISILYGGSVKAANAASLFAMPDIDGALVGGASLVLEECQGIYGALLAQKA